MCGIAGVVDLHAGLAPAEDLVATMTDALVHRGPDDAGMLVDGSVTLGHRRLSIIDLTDAGHQPMGSEDGALWITYNGEVYNYLELAAELRSRGHRFRSVCDTEVLLAAYAEWGPGALERLNGMFAFAIWDRRRRELFCARDRMGVKPFYYTVAGGRFRFASEIKALVLDPEVTRSANHARVIDFLAWGLLDHTEETLFEGIHQLPPGSHLTVTQRGVQRPITWYRPKPEQVNGQSPGEILSGRLTDAVRLRLRSDVPVGTTLSGGLDSSAVTTLATRLRAEEGAAPPTSFFSRCSNPRIDEGRYVDSVVRVTGSPNHAALPTEEDLLRELDFALWSMDEPFHSSCSYAHWKLMQLVRSEGITVLLDGQGGDEALAGYHYLLYPAVFVSLLVRGQGGRAIRELAKRREVNGVAFRRSLTDTGKLLLPGKLRRRRLPAWLAAEAPLEHPPTPARTVRGQIFYALDVAPLPLHNHEEDRNSMSFSIEARNPFLDYRIIELGLGFPPESLVRDGLSKWPLRQAVEGLVPDDVRLRSDKQGFSTDEAEWMRTGRLGAEMATAFASAKMADRGLFDAKGLAATLGEQRSGANRSKELWRAFAVERWFRLFIDPAQLRSPGRPPGSVEAAVRAADRITRLEPSGVAPAAVA